MLLCDEVRFFISQPVVTFVYFSFQKSFSRPWLLWTMHEVLIPNIPNYISVPFTLRKPVRRCTRNCWPSYSVNRPASSLPQPPPAPIGPIFLEAIPKIIPDDVSLETFNSQYLQRHSTCSRAILAAAKVLLNLGAPREEVEQTIFTSLRDEVTLDIPVCPFFHYIQNLSSSLFRYRALWPPCISSNPSNHREQRSSEQHVMPSSFHLLFSRPQKNKKLYDNWSWRGAWTLTVVRTRSRLDWGGSLVKLRVVQSRLVSGRFRWMYHRNTMWSTNIIFCVFAPRKLLEWRNKSTIYPKICPSAHFAERTPKKILLNETTITYITVC